MLHDRKDIDRLTEKIIGCGIAVHRAIGPGLLERIYRECLIIELQASSLPTERERRINLEYRGHRITNDLVIDIVVEGTVVIEVKAVERLHPVHQAQVITYLKLTGCPAGLLMNFNGTSLRAGLRRLEHPDFYIAK
jgi:GxxExxY protein